MKFAKLGEPPYTERYVRWCERTGANHPLLLDFLRRLLLPIPVMDTQCGCKAFTREAAEKLFRAELQFEGFGFDLEILMHALKLGLKTKEVGIKWIDKHGSKVNIVRDSFKMIKTVYKIRQKSIKEGVDAYD